MSWPAGLCEQVDAQVLPNVRLVPLVRASRMAEARLSSLYESDGFVPGACVSSRSLTASPVNRSHRSRAYRRRPPVSQPYAECCRLPASLSPRPGA